MHERHREHSHERSHVSQLALTEIENQLSGLLNSLRTSQEHHYKMAQKPVNRQRTYELDSVHNTGGRIYHQEHELENVPSYKKNLGFELALERGGGKRAWEMSQAKSAAKLAEQGNWIVGFKAQIRQL